MEKVVVSCKDYSSTVVFSSRIGLLIQSVINVYLFFSDIQWPVLSVSGISLVGNFMWPGDSFENYDCLEIIKIPFHCCVVEMCSQYISFWIKLRVF